MWSLHLYHQFAPSRTKLSGRLNVEDDTSKLAAERGLRHRNATRQRRAATALSPTADQKETLYLNEVRYICRLEGARGEENLAAANRTASRVLCVLDHVLVLLSTSGRTSLEHPHVCAREKDRRKSNRYSMHATNAFPAKARNSAASPKRQKGGTDHERHGLCTKGPTPRFWRRLRFFRPLCFYRYAHQS